MKYYHATDRFFRKRIREGSLGLLFVGVFLVLWIFIMVCMMYANILHLSFGINILFPLYCSTYATMLLVMRLHFKRLSSIVDAVVLRRILRVDIILCAVLACLSIPLHLSILQGYESHDAEIPMHILLIELSSYAFLFGLSLGQCILIWKSDRWPTTEDVENNGLESF